MPVQTTKMNVYFPDGCLVSVKESGAGSFSDVGAINSACTAVLNYTTNQVTTANAGNSVAQVREMSIAGGFTLVNLETEVIERMSGGIFERVTTTDSAVTASPVQTIAAGWSFATQYNLLPETSASDSTVIHASAIPTFDAITLSLGSSPEVLVADLDYVITIDADSPSGYSIQFVATGITTESPTTFDITIDYASVTPVASTTIYAGSSTMALAAYAMRLAHTDSAGLKRTLDLYSVNPDSGGFQFNFKGANEDGVEEMPLTFTAKLDPSLTDGRQLMAWTVETGAA